MQVDYAYYLLRFVYDDDRCDFFLFHCIEGFAGEDVRADGLRVSRHGIACGKRESCAALFFHQAAEVTVGDDAGEFSIGGEHGGHAKFLGAHFVEDVGHFRFERDARESVGGVHQMLDAKELFAEAASGVERGEVVVAEVAAFEERNGERVADGHCNRGARGRSEIQGARFFFHADVERDVAGFGERGFEIAGQRDERDFETFERFEEMDDFLRFAAVGDSDERVAARKHAEVAVESFAGVKEEGWRTGAGECC